jgi:ParB family transcriptional regulator, chromosome partitioning protein
MSRDILISLIDPDLTQPRKVFDPVALDSMAQSMAQRLIEAIKVRAVGERFIIIDGERRYRAAQALGWQTIRAEIFDVSAKEAREIQLIANIEREDLSPIEEAQAYRDYMSETGATQSEVARKFSRDKSRIGQLLNLLNTPQEVQDLVARRDTAQTETGKITEGHVREAMRATNGVDTVYTPVLMKAAQEGLNIQQTRRVAEAVAAAPSPEAKRKLVATEYSPLIHDPEEIARRAQRYGAHDAFYHDSTPTKQQQWEQTPEIKAVVNEVLETAKRSQRLTESIRHMDEVGKLAPESRQFIAHRVRQFIKQWVKLAEELDPIA